MSDFTHIDDKGRVRMVDVTAKKATVRQAIARGRVRMQPNTLALILSQGMAKGNVLETARIAGIMGAKRTAELIPMCHPLALTHIRIDFNPDPQEGILTIEAAVKIRASTGVEMEALTAVALAALTVYDMCKSHDRAMTINAISLVHKSGGKSGVFNREARWSGAAGSR
jgi:cyclic pyranopterin phosphate synthase